MPRDLASVRLDDHATCKYVLFVEGLPDAWTNDATGAITGSGLGTWIGASEIAVGGREILGTRRVRPGLIVPDVVSFSVDPKSGSLQPAPLTFQILDLDDSLATLFATEGQDSEILGERVAPGTTNLGASVQTIGGSGTTDPRGRWIGIEKIGPSGERRQWPALPFDLVGHDHPVHAGSDPPAGLPPVLISDVPLEFAGRLVSLYRIYNDPSAPSGPTDYTSYYTWDECHAAGDLVWWGVLQDAGRVAGSKVWGLDCHGPDKLLSKLLGTRNTSRWIRLSADLTLDESQSYVAIGFACRGAAGASVLQTFDSSVFDHQITATNRWDLASQIDAWIGDALDGTSTNVSGPSGTFDTWADAGGSPRPDAGLTSDGKFWIRRDEHDPLDDLTYGELIVVMHDRAWRCLGWEPELQAQANGPWSDLARAPFSRLNSGDVLNRYDWITGVQVPGTGYWIGRFNTIRAGASELDISDYDNGGAPRPWWPHATSEIFVLGASGSQVVRLQGEDETTLYLEGQLTDGPLSTSEIDGVATDSARWFALRGQVVVANDDPLTDEFEVSKEKTRHQVIAASWRSGTHHGAVSAGSGVAPALFVESFLNPRRFGWVDDDILVNDWSGKVTGKGAIEIAPLHAYHYLIEDTSLEQADTLLAQILLSTGACAGYDDALDQGGTIVAGPNTHPLAVGFAGDYELADLGLGVPYQLVQHPSELRRAFATVPGSWSGALCQLRLAYVGPFQASDVLESITRPRALCWSLAGKQYGLWRMQPVSPADADVEITEDDLHGQLGDPTSVIPTQELRATGQLDGVELAYRWNPEESKTTGTLKTFALDPGAAKRTGELIEKITDHGLTSFSGWRPLWRQLWQHDVPAFLAKRHFGVSLTVSRPKGQDLMPGTTVRLSNPWPVNPAGGYGITGYTGRVVTATHNLSEGSTTVELLVFAGQATRHYAPVVRISGVTGSVLSYHADHLGHGDADVLDGTGFAEPSWSGAGGATLADLYQRNGDTWTVVASGLTVTAVDTTARTITLSGPPSGWLRDRDHYLVLSGHGDQDADSWVRDVYGVTTDTDLTVGDASTPSFPYVG